MAKDASKVIYPSALSFYFSVTILDGNGKDAVAFQDVSGLSSEIEVETYIEGGGNTYAYRLPKGIKYQNLILSRGIASASSKLIKWCLRTLEGGLIQPIETKFMKISLLGPDAAPLHSWSLTGAYPVKWQAENFNSLKNDVAIEKLEFAFSSLTREKV
jgi:phage tail-like protein